jgi:predicted RNA-binding protein with PUA-like domain
MGPLGSTDVCQSTHPLDTSFLQAYHDRKVKKVDEKCHFVVMLSEQRLVGSCDRRKVKMNSEERWLVQADQTGSAVIHWQRALFER